MPSKCSRETRGSPSSVINRLVDDSDSFLANLKINSSLVVKRIENILCEMRPIESRFMVVQFLSESRSFLRNIFLEILSKFFSHIFPSERFFLGEYKYIKIIKSIFTEQIYLREFIRLVITLFIELWNGCVEGLEPVRYLPVYFIPYFPTIFYLVSENSPLPTRIKNDTFQRKP